jgi:sugar/nucleoside kinase (ribokinase family)
MTVPDGCYGYVRKEAGHALYRVTIDPLEARSPIGSGDAFLAGYVSARYEGREPVDCLRFGVACGAESTQHIGAGIIDPSQVERLLEGVESELVTLPAEVS